MAKDLVAVDAADEQSALTRAQFGQLAEVPAELEWLANITNAKTRRAYKIDVGEFSVFAGLQGPVEFRLVTRAHVIAGARTSSALEVLGSTVLATRNFQQLIGVQLCPIPQQQWLAT